MKTRFPNIKSAIPADGRITARLGLAGLGLWLACVACPGATTTLSLLPETQVDSHGIYLDQVVVTNTLPTAQRIRLMDAPAFGQMTVLQQTQIVAAIQPYFSEKLTNKWTGPDRIRVGRRTRLLNESELKDLLTIALQRDYVRDRGDLEVRFLRAWTAVRVPDEPVDLKIVDTPSSGLSANFIVRFELHAGKDVVGNFQLVCQAKIWQEICVAASPLRRGSPISPRDVTMERRDLLTIREYLTELPSLEEGIEVVESVMPGSPITPRMFRMRPSVFRGEMLDALFTNGAMSISMKVEILQDGGVGQVIRVRNPLSKRELRGKVQNDRSMQIKG